MRKFSIMLLAAVAVLMASCKDDLNDNTTAKQGSGELKTFKIRTGIPNGSIKTYAPGAGNNESHKGGLANVDTAEFNLRYIVEAYQNEQRVAREMKIEPFTTGTTSTGVEFEISVSPGIETQLAFWADFVPKNILYPEQGYWYNTTSNSGPAGGLTAITLQNPPSFSYKLSDDTRDAYSGRFTIDENAVELDLGEITLKRPFGKIRLISTDKADGAKKAPGSVVIKYQGDIVPEGYDALKQSPFRWNGPSFPEICFSNAVKETNLVVGGVALSGEYYVLSYDYIFAPSLGSGTTTAIPFTVQVYDSVGGNGNKLGALRTLSSIPAVTNKLTTVIGNFYKDDVTYKMRVYVDDEFAELDNSLRDDVFDLAVPPLVTAAADTFKLQLPNFGNDFWHEVYDTSWIEIHANEDGWTRYDVLRMAIAENTGGLRKGYVKIRLADETYKTVSVTQEAAAFGSKESEYYLPVPGALDAMSSFEWINSYTSPLVSMGNHGVDSIIAVPEDDGSKFNAVNFKFTLGGTTPDKIIVKVVGLSQPPTHLLIKDNVGATSASTNVLLYATDTNEADTESGSVSPAAGGTYYLSVGVHNDDRGRAFRVIITAKNND